jgi:hypothetical protein
MEREYTCNRCEGEYYSSDPATDRNGLCGECAELYAYSKLARQTLRAHGGRGDSASANIVMGFPTFGDGGFITYAVREHGGSIPRQQLCAAHDALYMSDAVWEGGLTVEEARSHYMTQRDEGQCDTCNEFEAMRGAR